MSLREFALSCLLCFAVAAGGGASAESELVCPDGYSADPNSTRNARSEHRIGLDGGTVHGNPATFGADAAWKVGGNDTIADCGRACEYVNSNPSIFSNQTCTHFWFKERSD